MVDSNTEQMIDRLLHLIEADPGFQERLRENFDRTVQVAGVSISLDAIRGFLKGSATYSVDDPLESLEDLEDYDDGTISIFTIC